MFWKDCWKCGKYSLEIVSGRPVTSYQLHDVSIDHVTILSDPGNEEWGITTGGFAIPPRPKSRPPPIHGSSPGFGGRDFC